MSNTPSAIDKFVEHAFVFERRFPGPGPPASAKVFRALFFEYPPVPAAWRSGLPAVFY